MIALLILPWLQGYFSSMFLITWFSSLACGLLLPCSSALLLPCYAAPVLCCSRAPVLCCSRAMLLPCSSALLLPCSLSPIKVFNAFQCFPGCLFAWSFIILVFLTEAGHSEARFRVCISWKIQHRFVEREWRPWIAVSWNLPGDTWVLVCADKDFKEETCKPASKDIWGVWQGGNSSNADQADKSSRWTYYFEFWTRFWIQASYHLQGDSESHGTAMSNLLFLESWFWSSKCASFFFVYWQCFRKTQSLVGYWPGSFCLQSSMFQTAESNALKTYKQWC